MIYKTLNIVVNKLNDYISNKFNLDEKIILLASTANSDSTAETLNLNKLVLSLVNIARDTSMGINFKSQSYSNSQPYKSRPPISLNLFVLISANFAEKNYDEAIKYISTALEFVQSNDLITKYNTAELDPSILKLHLELVTLELQELSNLWSIHGGKYLPSFYLKIKMLTIDKEEIDSIETEANKIDFNLK
jgi:hypothetical protein